MSASPQAPAGATGSASRDGRRRPWLTLPGGVGVTPRAIALLVVLAVLMISYANSVRIYLDQEAEIAALQLETERRQQTIDDLNADLSRWQDEDYVRAQARERLGWVVPGETGFRVIGPDGQGIGASIDSDRRTPASDLPPVVPWWGKAWGSIEAADHPAPPPEPTENPADRPPITTDDEGG